MPRETARQKADRLLLEGRILVTFVRPDRHLARAVVRGEGHAYRAGFDNGAWWCQCPARTDHCSHLFALRRVVCVDLDEALR